ncbi:MAG: PHP-associated domain-containing protein [bacterium]
MLELKTDLHLHTSDDREDTVRHSAQDLIVHAANQGFKVLAITNHDTFTYSRDLEKFASDHGILLIPGIEKEVEGKHILLLNAFPATEKIKTFEDLQKAKNDGLFVIAPHPFFKRKICLENKLYEYVVLFDALEFSFFYSKRFNCNQKALQFSAEQGLPVVGNSDCHFLKYLGICHSIIRVEEQSMVGVFSAIRNKNIEIVSQPIFFPKLATIYLEMLLNKYHDAFLSKNEKAIFKPEQKVEDVCV